MPRKFPTTIGKIPGHFQEDHYKPGLFLWTPISEKFTINTPESTSAEVHWCAVEVDKNGKGITTHTEKILKSLARLDYPGIAYTTLNFSDTHLVIFATPYAKA